MLGEWHFDPAMIQREKEFLELLRRHGVQTLIIEYPKDQQARLNRYLENPTYANMADALEAFILEMVGMEPAKRAKVVARLAHELQAVDANPREAQRADPNLTDARVAFYQAEMRMARMWLAANRMGFAVLAGDLPRNVGLDKTTGKLVTENPTSDQILDYLMDPRGMHDRNESMKQVAEHSRGPFAIIAGEDHVGFGEGRLNDMFERDGLRVIAIAPGELSPEGRLAESAAYGLDGKSLEELNAEMRKGNAQDPFRAVDDRKQPAVRTLVRALWLWWKQEEAKRWRREEAMRNGLSDQPWYEKDP
ncbi:hypothetical protein [Methylacidimicrobium sp. B4]|uniref:hypothetical protein n=1 Tax=Methylacidimicrobium sp. B4 TaxID=2796139 RepID=UPI001A8E1379|nr:hypothetical protein [Methylacidimicrobium sp. B4]QSR85649.1 hypothetical protein MacB4_05375 [Methylacidimicrobium sp. B4]